MNAQGVIYHITNYVNTHSGTSRSQWYVGIASDVNQRLFGDHNVSKDGGDWNYAPADTSEIARSVERFFLDLGFDGGPGGGDASTKVVYAYIKTFSTEP